MIMEISIIFFGAIVFLAHLFVAVFEKTRIPDVLPLIFLGVLLGPVFGLVRPSDFGNIADIFITISLIVILFQSGLELKLSQIRDSWLASSKLAVLNFFGSLIIITLFGTILLNTDLVSSLILASILAGTSFGVVIPLVSKLTVSNNCKTTLTIESAFSDLLCIVFTLGFLGMAHMNKIDIISVFQGILFSFVVASIIGVVAGMFWSYILNHIRHIENGIVLTLAFSLVVYGLSELVGSSGAIAVLFLGIISGNMKSFRRLKYFGFLAGAEEKITTFNMIEKTFISEAVFLFKIFFFLFIGISIQMSNPYLIACGVLITIAVYLVRIIATRWSVKKDGFSRVDASVISAMGPKGLVAAVLAALVVKEQISSVLVIQDVVYTVILFSIITTTILAFMLEKGYFVGIYGIIFSGYPDKVKKDSKEHSERLVSSRLTITGLRGKSRADVKKHRNKSKKKKS